MLMGGADWPVGTDLHRMFSSKPGAEKIKDQADVVRTDVPKAYPGLRREKYRASGKVL